MRQFECDNKKQYLHLIYQEPRNKHGVHAYHVIAFLSLILQGLLAWLHKKVKAVIVRKYL